MLRKILSVIAVVAALALGAPAAAHAEEDYPPPPPGNETLAGSFAVSECDRGAPWIRYRVLLTDPDGEPAGRNATLVLSRGGEVAEIPLGTLEGNEISGRVLWPGASVDGAGNPTGWPGFAHQNGQWVQTEGNFAWTRGAISAEIRVGSSLSVPLGYPQSTPACGPATAGVGAESGLAVTGGTVSLAAAGAGIALVLVGGAVMLRRRRATQ